MYHADAVRQSGEMIDCRCLQALLDYWCPLPGVCVCVCLCVCLCVNVLSKECLHSTLSRASAYSALSKVLCVQYPVFMYSEHIEYMRQSRYGTQYKTQYKVCTVLSIKLSIKFVQYSV